MIQLGGEVMPMNLTYGDLVKGLQKSQSIYWHLCNLILSKNMCGSELCTIRSKSSVNHVFATKVFCHFIILCSWPHFYSPCNPTWKPSDPQHELMLTMCIFQKEKACTYQKIKLFIVHFMLLGIFCILA